MLLFTAKLYHSGPMRTRPDGNVDKMFRLKGGIPIFANTFFETVCSFHKEQGRQKRNVDRYVEKCGKNQAYVGKMKKYLKIWRSGGKIFLKRWMFC